MLMQKSIKKVTKASQCMKSHHGQTHNVTVESNRKYARDLVPVHKVSSKATVASASSERVWAYSMSATNTMYVSARIVIGVFGYMNVRGMEHDQGGGASR